MCLEDFKTGKVVQLVAERKKFCKRTSKTIPGIQYNTLHAAQASYFMLLVYHFTLKERII
jgi:hypothetical protein